MDGWPRKPISLRLFTSDGSESSLFPNPIAEEKGKEHMYSIDNEVVNDLIIHTR